MEDAISWWWYIFRGYGELAEDEARTAVEVDKEAEDEEIKVWKFFVDC